MPFGVLVAYRDFVDRRFVLCGDQAHGSARRRSGQATSLGEGLSS